MFSPSELSGFPLFAGLDTAMKERLLLDHQVMMLPAGQYLIFQGDWSNGLFLIRSGIVKVRILTLDGEEVVMALMGAGEIIGELAMLMGHGRRSADVVSLTPLEVVKIRCDSLQRELDLLPSFSLALARLQAKRILMLDKLLSLRGEDATTRVLVTLLELARCASYEKDPHGLVPPLSQSEIAAIAGLARGTTSTILNRLRTRGIVVETSEGLRITNVEALRRRGLLDDD